MKNTKVSLAPLCPEDKEQFILDNQWAFKYGAMLEFGERDNHVDEEHDPNEGPDEMFRFIKVLKPYPLG